ncbi:type II toxin-antitoxin system PemK/MazF family toxin [Streptomyces sp. ST2-7A]|nr:type II toxin-antitoxin system PemK/MazF family toxin [Streptomyces sp. ST2-7A]
MVLTVDRVAGPLASVTVAVVTGTREAETTHVAVGPESDLRRHDESYVNCSDLHTVAKSRLRRGMGLLGGAEMRAVEKALALVLGL